MKRQHYQTLDIATDASPEDIKKAYRDKAKETHPDKNEGDDRGFVAVNAAYEVLSDPERRKKYDETGDDKERDDHGEVLSIITQLSMAFMDQARDVKTKSLTDFVKNKINEAISHNNELLVRTRGDVEKANHVMNRIKCKEGDNMILEMIKSKAEQLEGHVLGIERHLMLMNMALEEIGKYSCLVDKEEKGTITTAQSHGSWMEEILVSNFNRRNPY